MQDQNLKDLRQRINAKRAVASGKNMPKLCQVCSGASFLKCMECDTIYCSAKCQIKDWEDHQYLHAQNRGSYSVRNRNVKPPSVQSRLSTWRDPMRDMITAQTKANVQEQTEKLEDEPMAVPEKLNPPLMRSTSTASTMEVDEVSNKLQSVTIGSAVAEIQHPINEEAQSLIEMKSRKMLAIRKFTRHVQFTESEADSQGFNYASVTEVDRNIDGSTTYWVMPVEFKKFYDNYKKNINEVYEDHGIPNIAFNDLPSFKKSLVMAKINGSWARATILHILPDEKVVGLVDIDTGKKFIGIYPLAEIKSPLESEFMKSAYAIKVMLENADSDSIDSEECIKIKITVSDPFGINVGIVKLDDGEPEELEDAIQVPPTPPVKTVCDQPLVLELLEVKNMQLGPKVKLMFIDGSKLEQGLLHVCESVAENWNFYTQIEKDIKEYVKQHPSAGKYKPVIQELVLAKYKDGYYYRAVCMNASDFDAKVCFIDYGSINDCDLNDIMKMPKSMIVNSCSHSAKVQLVSGRDVFEINVEETRAAMEERNEFIADVKKDGTRYVITIDDSLVVFKK